MAKHVKISKFRPNFKWVMAFATVLLTLVASLQISAASATEPVPSMLGPFGGYADSTGPAFEPRELTVIGDTVYFTAVSSAFGRELWKSDGTLEGTVLVRDINEASSDSGVSWLTAVGDTLFFVADDGVHGSELWKSGGTSATTVRAVASSGVMDPSDPSDLTAVNGDLYFAASRDDVGTELFKHDVAAGATTLVEDIDSVEVVDTEEGNYPASSNPTNLTWVGNDSLGFTLFFTVETVENGEALWKHDLADGSTTLVKGIQVDIGRANFAQLTAVEDTLYFAANDGVHGRELWMSNGTAVGTKMVKDIMTGSAPGNPNSLTAMGETLFFKAFNGTHYELWKTDSLAIGDQAISESTVRVGNTSGLAPAYEQSMIVLGSYLYFSADDGSTGDELWRTTDGGTPAIVKNIRPGIDGGQPFGLSVMGSTLYFTVDDGITGSELWKSDGSEGGTVRVADINPFGGASIGSLTVLGSTLLFVADNGTDGYELWSLAPASIPPVTLPPTNTGSSSSDTPTPTPSPTPTSPVATEPSTTKAVRFSRFVADSGKLPALASQGIARTLSGYSTIDRVVCTGFTSGVKATPLGRKVALQRAQNACNVVKRLAPKALIQVRVNVASGVGSKFRRVQLSITGN